MPRPPRRSACIVFVALLVATATLSPVAAAADAGSGAAGETTVSVTPGNVSTTVGETTTVDIVVDSAPDGIDGYQFNASLDDAGVADITDITLRGSPMFPDASIGPNNDSASIAATGTDFDSNSPVIVTLELTGTAVGTTGVSVTPPDLRDNSGARYEVNGVTDSTLTVAKAGTNVTVTSLLGPGKLNQSETGTVETTIKNTGDTTGTQSVSFRVDGTERATRDLSLSVGQRTTVEFELDATGLAGGTHTYSVFTVDDNATRTFSVVNPDPSVALGFDPTTANATVGESTTIDVVADAIDGLQGFQVTVELDNETVGTIEGVEYVGDPAFQTTTMGPSGTTVEIEAGYTTPLAGSDDLTLFSLNVTGDAVGETEVSFVSAEVSDGSNDRYDIRSLGTGALNVSAEQSVSLTVPGGSGPATNLDDDPLLEDVDGDGDADIFDVLTYYNARNSDVVRNNPEQFDYDGSAPVGTVFDALALYNELGA